MSSALWHYHCRLNSKSHCKQYFLLKNFLFLILIFKKTEMATIIGGWRHVLMIITIFHLYVDIVSQTLMTLSIFYDFWLFRPLKMMKYTTAIYGICNHWSEEATYNDITIFYLDVNWVIQALMTLSIFYDFLGISSFKRWWHIQLRFMDFAIWPNDRGDFWA